MGLKPWKILSSKEAFKNRWWNIVQETVELPDGSVADDLFINDLAGGAIVFALTEGGKVVLNRQYKHGAREIVTELAIGGLKMEDASPLASAKRELLEETGYGEGSWEPLGVFRPNPTSSRARVYAFLARGVRKVAEPEADPRELVETELVDPRVLPKMIAEGAIVTEPAIATICLALMKLGIFPTGS